MPKRDRVTETAEVVEDALQACADMLEVLHEPGATPYDGEWCERVMLRAKAARMASARVWPQVAALCAGALRHDDGQGQPPGTEGPVARFEREMRRVREEDGLNVTVLHSADGSVFTAGDAEGASS